jgi:hypothetical protein
MSSGKHVLVLSFSGFDPTEFDATRQLETKLINPEPKKAPDNAGA